MKFKLYISPKKNENTDRKIVIYLSCPYAGTDSHVLIFTSTQYLLMFGQENECQPVATCPNLALDSISEWVTSFITWGNCLSQSQQDWTKINGVQPRCRVNGQLCVRGHANIIWLNAWRQPNAVSMLGQHWRWWPDIEKALGRRQIRRQGHHRLY